MATFNEKELQSIQELRDKVCDQWKDAYLLSNENLSNWLSYKKWKVEKAEKAIRRNIKWREDTKVDELAQEVKNDDFYSKIKYITGGADKQGRPIICGCLDQLDTQVMLNTYLADKDKGDRFNIYRTEVMFDLVKKAHAATNGKVNSGVFMADCKGLKLKPFMSKLIDLIPRAGRLAKDVERNYPGLLETTYIINAPNKVNTLFTLIKPFLKSETTKKFKIFGKKDDKWKEIVLKEIDPDQLGLRFGGTKPDDS